jgi:hypothetical protein
MQNNSVLSQVWKSAHLLIFWVLTFVVSRFTVVHNAQNSSYSAALCMGNSILKYWHHISGKCNFSLLNHNYPNQDENNIRDDKPWLPSNRFLYLLPPPSRVDVTAWRHRPNDAPSNNNATLEQGSFARVSYLAWYTCIVKEPSQEHLSTPRSICWQNEIIQLSHTWSSVSVTVVRGTPNIFYWF